MNGTSEVLPSPIKILAFAVPFFIGHLPLSSGRASSEVYNSKYKINTWSAVPSTSEVKHVFLLA